MLLFFFDRKIIFCTNGNHVYLRQLSTIRCFLRSDSIYTFQEPTFSWSEGDSQSESSPVKQVRQFWIKRLYPPWSVALTVDVKLRSIFNRHEMLNGCETLQYHDRKRHKRKKKYLERCICICILFIRKIICNYNFNNVCNISTNYKL